MSDTQLHSPLPWRQDRWWILSASNEAIVDSGFAINQVAAEANAAYIVRACNAYPHAEQLAEALRELIEALPQAVLQQPLQSTRAKAIAALTAWKEASQ
jgi:hypothetical protein